MSDQTKKTEGQQKQEALSYKKKNYYETADKAELKKIFDYAEGYKRFLDAAKTEREACAVSVEKIGRAHV